MPRAPWMRKSGKVLGLEQHVRCAIGKRTLQLKHHQPERLQRLSGFQKVNFLYGPVDYTDSLEVLH